MTDCPVRLRCVAFALSVVLLAGCASMRNTPRQDATYALFAQCKAETGADVTLDRVEPNGRISRWTLNASSGGYYDHGMADCLRSKGRRVAW